MADANDRPDGLPENAENVYHHSKAPLPFDPETHVYDSQELFVEKVVPLLRQVAEICKENHLPVLVAVQTGRRKSELGCQYAYDTRLATLTVRMPFEGEQLLYCNAIINREVDVMPVGVAFMGDPLEAMISDTLARDEKAEDQDDDPAQPGPFRA